MTSVAILGGGVAGLSAAHELAERGFETTVYEWGRDFGGKARSMDVPDTAVGDRAPLPGEHGFRFFPGFYRHVIDTMQRIPDGGRTVADHLVPTRGVMISQDGGRDEIVTISERPNSIDDVGTVIEFVRKLSANVGVPGAEMVSFGQRMITLLSSCDERRFGQWEQMSWWEFVGAADKSAAFQKFLATGMTRALVAARAREMSARTGGLILLQLLFDMVGADARVPRVLDGPTSDVWIEPWIAHLGGLGVTLRQDCEVAGIDCQGKRITGVTLKSGERVTADYYLSAMPKERLELLLSPKLLAAEPRLAGLPRLVTRWMNGAMFYFAVDVPMQSGHAIFIDSEWALTAVSQAQFWQRGLLAARGDGQVAGILSVDISEWSEPGRQIRKAAMACTKEEIRTEVWAQLTAHIDDGSLDEANVVDFFLDPAIKPPNPTLATNLEPLLVNTSGSWSDRPDAVTAIDNFFLASDFVRTYTDLATMEGANEAARRAVNGILDASGSAEKRCQVWPLREPSLFEAARKADRVLWAAGRQPVKPPVILSPDGKLEPAGFLARGLAGVFGLLGG